MPLTPEQVEEIAEHKAQSVLKCYRNRALAGFLILLSGLAIGGVVQETDRRDRRDTAAQQREAVVDSGNASVISGCNRDFVVAQRIQGIFKVFEIPEQLFPLPDCRDTEGLVTQDPDKNIVVPEALYPGSPLAPKPPKLELPDQP